MRPSRPRRAAGRDRVAGSVAAAALLLAVLAYGGYRLWHGAGERLRAAVVVRDANAAPLLDPPLGERLSAILNRRPPGPRAKLVALTFDDGPYPVTTPILLQTLRELRVPATFFLIGRDAEQFPDLARAISADGDEIGDHTETHPNLDQLAPSAVTAELRDGAASLERIAPQRSESEMFRPPHGRFTLATIRAAQAAGFDTILWNDDPGDWRAVRPAELVAHVRAHATAPEIVLLHDGRMPTVVALPAIVASFRAAGYTFVTVGELLRRSTPAEINRPERLTLR
ncbi:MAG TPA: polysaccharide deacetylase family protein [Candidatus Baltobacteraceae bacterium]|nr:polysaccharide deacetylase family protein [Candidatus Baltobacteraceae bacterium]